MKVLRVLFMGTPDFAVPTLRELIEGPDEVVGVVTQPDRPSGRRLRLTPPPVKALAASAGLRVFQPERLKGHETFEAIAATRPDVCVVIAYGRILGPRFLELPPLSCFNVHASLLPRWRGAAPINWAVVAGDAVTGITIQKMDRGLDTGPIARTWSTEIDPLETAGELHDRLAPAGATLMAEVLEDLRAGRPLQTRPQDDSKATYARMLTKEDGWVSFERGPEAFADHVRGMTSWPGAVCDTPRGPLKLLRARPEPIDSAHDPGAVILGDSAAGLVVAVNGGAVRILECQRPGGQPMRAIDYLNGLHTPIAGERWWEPQMNADG